MYISVTFCLLKYFITVNVVCSNTGRSCSVIFKLLCTSFLPFSFSLYLYLTHPLLLILFLEMLVAGKGTSLTFVTYYVVYNLDKHLPKCIVLNTRKKSSFKLSGHSVLLFVKEILERGWISYFWMCDIQYSQTWLFYASMILSLES